MRPHLMNAQRVEELEQRFDEVGHTQPAASYRTPAVDPADPVRQVDVSRATCCTPAEFRALELATRQEFLVRLDRWRNEDQRIERIFTNLKRR
jgi:hypothetical protein